MSITVISQAAIPNADAEVRPTADTESKSSESAKTRGASAAEGKSAPDEIEFFNFAKQYMGLVAGLAAVPLVTNGLGVIPTPNGFGLKDLSAVASLLCIIVFGAVFSLRHILGRTQEARHYFWRMVPAFGVLTALGLAMWQISVYLPQVTSANRQLSPVIAEKAGASNRAAEVAILPGQRPSTSNQMPSSPRATQPGDTTSNSGPDLGENAPILIAQYLGIQVLIVFAIGVVLITAFTMQEAHQIQNMIERDMQKQRFELLERIKYTDAFYRLARTNKGSEETGQELVLNARHHELKLLADGRINAFGDSARHLQEFLLKYHVKAFDAVSDRDLDFWKRKDIEPFSQAYDQLLASAAERGTRLSRLLLFSDEQLVRWRCISKVIRDHEEQGYGWAVAPYRTVERSVLDTEHDLDFALFDGNAAISYFRDYHSSFRHLEVIFNNVAGLPVNSQIIDDQAIRYLKLCAQAWVCNKPFAERISTITQEQQIGTKKLSDVAVRESSKCLKASTLGDTNSIPEQVRAKVRARVKDFAPQASASTEQADWRGGMMIDSRDLQGEATQLSEEDLDLIAWTLLWYRRKAKNWDPTLTCDMLLITNMAAIPDDSSLTADVRGIDCSLEHHEDARMTVHLENVHGEIVLDHVPHAIDKSQYDITEDLYQLRVKLPQDLPPGRYKWELAASDGAGQSHCARKTNRILWFNVAVPSQVDKRAARATV